MGLLLFYQSLLVIYKGFTGYNQGLRGQGAVNSESIVNHVLIWVVQVCIRRLAKLLRPLQPRPKHSEVRITEVSHLKKKITALEEQVLTLA